MMIPFVCLFFHATLMHHKKETKKKKQCFIKNYLNFISIIPARWGFLFSIKARFYINKGHKVSYHLAAAACISNENLWNPPPTIDLCAFFDFCLVFFLVFSPFWLFGILLFCPAMAF